MDVAIAGVIADVTVRQVYENRGQRPLHARYIFPASTRAAVYGMTMTVGDVRIVAKIKEREQAKTEFESAKREGKSASLLEQSRPNVFSMSVANVLPGDTISVELEIHRAARADRRPVRVRVPDRRRTAVLREARSQALPAEAREGGSRETSSSRLRTRARARPRAASSISPVCVSSGVPFQELASPSHQVVFRDDRPRARGDGARRIRDVLGQSRLHPSLPAGRPEDWRGTAPLSGAEATRTSSC